MITSSAGSATLEDTSWAKNDNWIGQILKGKKLQGGHRTEKSYTGRGGHRTYFVDEGNYWGGDTAHISLMGGHWKNKVGWRLGGWLAGLLGDCSTTS